jgi:hypothetical protein
MAPQLHAKVMPPCDCINNFVSLWYYHCKFLATGVDFDDNGISKQVERKIFISVRPACLILVAYMESKLVF